MNESADCTEHNIAAVREDIVKYGYLRNPNRELMEKYQKILARGRNQ